MANNEGQNQSQNQSDANQFNQFLWEKGSFRVMHATWTAMIMSYGLNDEEIVVWAEYFSLLSRCLMNISIALGETLYTYEVFENEEESPFIY